MTSIAKTPAADRTKLLCCRWSRTSSSSAPRPRPCWSPRAPLCPSQGGRRGGGSSSRPRSSCRSPRRGGVRGRGRGAPGAGGGGGSRHRRPPPPAAGPATPELNTVSSWSRSTHYNITWMSPPNLPHLMAGHTIYMMLWTQPGTWPVLFYIYVHIKR